MVGSLNERERERAHFIRVLMTNTNVDVLHSSIDCIVIAGHIDEYLCLSSKVA